MSFSPATTNLPSDFTSLIFRLSATKAQERTRALKEIGESKIPKDRVPEITEAVMQKLEDASVTVQRQAVKTLMRLQLQQVPDALKILHETTEDDELKALVRAVIRRIELERERVERGEIEWNTNDYVFSVSDFLVYINTILGEEEVLIKGEVSDITTFRENLTFFGLKDAAGAVSCWFPTVNKYQWNVELREGIEIVVKVHPQISPKSGRFGLRVLEMRLTGEGALAAALAKLKARLEGEGLFDPARKRQLPFLPGAIGLITGENSAAYSDFVKVLGARMGGIAIYFAPVRVQGVGSIAEIRGAISYLNTLENIDCIVLTRGGGSIEDLQSFNSEEVTRAVFSSRHPIVVAVGHEKDWSLAEFAADTRASTPSNAAELIAPHRDELAFRLQSAARFIDQAVSGALAEKKRAVYTAAVRVGSHLTHKIQFGREFISRLPMLANRHARLVLDEKEAVNRAEEACLLHCQKWYTLKRNRFLELEKLIRSYSPMNTLKRGYSIVKLGDRIVRSSKDVSVGDEVKVYPYNGVIGAIVKENISNPK